MMLRTLLLLILGIALLAVLAGYLGSRVMPPMERSQRTERSGQVVSASWPSLQVKSGDRTWTLNYWPLHPNFEAGQQVSIATAKNDENEASLLDVSDWPLRYMGLGGLVAIITIFVLAATWGSGPGVPPGAMPQFPVTLHEPRFVAYLLLTFGGLCVIGSIAALILMPAEAPWYAYLNYIAGMAFGAVLVFGGVHFASGKIVVTEKEIVETSRVAKLSVTLNQVQLIEKQPIYGEKLNRRLSGPDPIIGWTLVFKGADGSDLYRSSTALEPRDDYQKVINYLFQRFPVTTKK